MYVNRRERRTFSAAIQKYCQWRCDIYTYLPWFVIIGGDIRTNRANIFQCEMQSARTHTHTAKRQRENGFPFLHIPCYAIDRHRCRRQMLSYSKANVYTCIAQHIHSQAHCTSNISARQKNTSKENTKKSLSGGESEEIF